MMKLRALLVVSVLLLGSLPSIASAESGYGLKYGSWSGWDRAKMPPPLRLASGVAAAGQTDPNVTVIPPGGSSQAAVVCSNVPGDWAAALPGSNWISIQSDCTASLAVDDYQYDASFSLLSNTGPLQIRGWVMADDSVTVQLNGHTLFSGGGFTETSSFSSDDASLFNAGANTLTFVVHNKVVGPTPTGLNFVVDVSPGEALGVARNHGQCVSSIAHQTARGRGHGRAVSEAARYTCWGEDDEDD